MSDESGFQIGRDAASFYETHVSRFIAPFVEALVARTASAGSSVLDVACGTGFATRAAAAVAGVSARIEGLDLNPSMLNQARAVPDDSGAELRWREASALALPYEDSTFDAVICQQGLPFFPDPGAGIKEMARVARARAAAVVQPRTRRRRVGRTDHRRDRSPTRPDLCSRTPSGAALVELGDHLAEYRTDEGIRVPFNSYLVTATRRSGG